MEFVLNNDNEVWMDFLDTLEEKEYDPSELLAMVTCLANYLKEEYGLSTGEEAELPDEEYTGPRIVH